ncbi:uncharacterized protein LOC113228616 isoform X2 [Hyposmocoma kahamanoa]|uniref:uncharacterized protein LOC113228616 isoform X2 n=1 Tax=Hyposmocoma kahamanoa TaxID=1477025 RepID=UPI000E6D9FFD|nr:uncharacterized protein LOC113228616 isoform X2 [Hyposmocoma kahamanoa]
MWGFQFNFVMYSVILFSLFVIDYALGNGLVDTMQKWFCNIVCFVRSALKEEDKHFAQVPGAEDKINLLVVIGEVIVLSVTMILLKKYKRRRGIDRIDQLLQESKEAIRQTNEFLEKWRLRRLNWYLPPDYTYLDEEPQEIKPLKLEVPVLHMAIIDTRGTARSQPESGDAGDSINFTDSALLSVSSIMDDDSEYMAEQGVEEKISEETQPKNLEFQNRYLWDVMEEDSNLED